MSSAVANGPRDDVRGSSVRVALGATGIVALFYLAVAAVVFLAVTNVLTSQLDSRLLDTLHRITDPGRPQPGGGFEAPPPDRPYGPTTLVWTIQANGTILSNTSGAELPPAAARATAPTTVSVGGTDVRIVVGSAGTSTVIVGQITAQVTETQATVLVAEFAIGPLLLLLVFGGAVAIGRRVAAPIERARQRQLDFTADASHELRTPLSVIEAQTSLALTGPREPTADRDAFDRIARESRRLHTLIEDMLWLARFDATRGAPTAEPVDVSVLAEATADRFAVRAEARHLSLTVAVEPGDHVVAIPTDWLDRLLGVLADNACKYAPDGGSVRIAIGSEGGRVQLEVDDSGPGIPIEERERIFDRFQRASSSGSGAGLGLAIADSIVRASGGRWRVGTSSLGGASMAVSWPRVHLGDGAAPTGR